MSTLPSHVTEFLSSRRVAVAGVSRTGTSAANAIFARLRRAGFDVFPINPHTTELEGVRAYPTITAIGTPVDGVVVATHPDVAVAVREAAGAGVRRVWFHRSFGQGSVSQAAVDECRTRGIRCIVGGWRARSCSVSRWTWRIGACGGGSSGPAACLADTHLDGEVPYVRVAANRSARLDVFFSCRPLKSTAHVPPSCETAALRFWSVISSPPRRAGGHFGVVCPHPSPVSISHTQPATRSSWS
jgi:uncharacterized protein